MYILLGTLILSFVVLGLIHAVWASVFRRMMNGFVALILLFALPFISFWVADWRIEAMTKSLFEQNMTLATLDYRRGQVSELSSYALGPFGIENPSNRGHDACVEVYVNLPNSYGGMTGYQWYSQYYYWNPQRNAGWFEKLFNPKPFWTWSQIYANASCDRPHI